MIKYEKFPAPILTLFPYFSVECQLSDCIFFKTSLFTISNAIVWMFIYRILLVIRMKSFNDITKEVQSLLNIKFKVKFKFPSLSLKSFMNVSQDLHSFLNIRINKKRLALVKINGKLRFLCVNKYAMCDYQIKSLRNVNREGCTFQIFFF